MNETTVELVQICFYCGGNPKFQPAYMRVHKHDKFIILDSVKPCEQCASLMNTGICFFEMDTEASPGRLKFDDEWYFTGRWVVAPKENAEKMFGGKIPANVVKQGYALLTIAQYKQGGCDVNPNPKH